MDIRRHFWDSHVTKWPNVSFPTFKARAFEVQQAPGKRAPLKICYKCSAEYRYSKFGPSFFIHEPPPNDSGHPSSIDIESTDFEDNLETDVLSSSHHTAEPDFRPFSSRIDAMAYLIVHSPRPMVVFTASYVSKRKWEFYIEALEQYPNQCGSWIISGVQCVPVNAILCVLPQAGTLAEHIYKPDQIVGTTSLTQLNDGEYMAFTTPHPLKKRSIELGNMPKENAKLENIHFICTSNKVSVLEFAVAPVQELKLLEDGIVAYDAAMQSDVLIVSPVLCLLCDNPRAAQICSHLGSSTWTFCRICNVDVTVGLHVHEKRTKTETVQQRSAIMAARTKGQINELKKRFGVSDATNPILDLCVDANQTPFEALLLGLYKYLFRLKIKKLSTNEKEELRARISAFSFFGCDAHFSRDMTRYYKSFVGRDLLNLQFIYYHRVWMMVKKKVWFKLSKVFRIAYCQPFDPEMVGSYESDCSSCVTAIQAHFPNLKRKLKVHLLLHLCESMLQFGPPLAYNTEWCESFNSIIRAKNIFSNKHSPSKYIATNVGVEESIRNICSGISDKFGAELVELYKSDVVSEYLGKHVESEKCIYQQGTLRKLSTAALELGAIKMTIPEHGTILLSQAIASCTLDFILYKSANISSQEIGLLSGGFRTGESSYCIIQLLEPETAISQGCILDEFDCPLLTMVDFFCVIPSSSVCAAVSVVHKCTTTCSFVEKTASAVVEECDTSVNRLVFVHDWTNTVYFDLKSSRFTCAISDLKRHYPKALISSSRIFSESVAAKDGNKYRILRITLEAHCSSITPNLWHSCESESPARTSLLHVSQDTITSQRRHCVRDCGPGDCSGSLQAREIMEGQLNNSVTQRKLYPRGTVDGYNLVRTFAAVHTARMGKVGVVKY
ncbi:hypothetical protein EMCRGX_G030040 [Ephydatia muelleri]